MRGCICAPGYVAACAGTALAPLANSCCGWIADRQGLGKRRRAETVGAGKPTGTAVAEAPVPATNAVNEMAADHSAAVAAAPVPATNAVNKMAADRSAAVTAVQVPIETRVAASAAAGTAQRMAAAREAGTVQHIAPNGVDRRPCTERRCTLA